VKILRLTLLLTLLSISSYSSASTSKFDCKYLDYHLVLEAKGFKHIVHELSINGEILITELLVDNWFMEEINCKKSGYEIVASHIQYNDPVKQVFKLTYSYKRGYKIIKSR